MIGFTLLDKDDLKVFFEGFDTEFLMIPLKRPSKSLLRYIPSGFRSGKLPRQLAIRVFCDAVKGNESSICEFVTNEVSRNFEVCGITQYCESHDLNDIVAQNQALIEISSLLWENGMTIPAYMVLLLFGIECSGDLRSLSKYLHDSYFAGMERSRLDAEHRSQQQTQQQVQQTQDTAEKERQKLQKRISSYEEEETKNVAEITRLNHQLDQVNAELQQSHQIHLNDEQQLAMLLKQNTALKNDNDRVQIVVEGLKKEISDLKQQLSEFSGVKREIDELRDALEAAKSREYSETILKRLCSDVLDELRSSSLGSQQVLDIAKKKFSTSDTVYSAWVGISAFSEAHIQAIIGSIIQEDLSDAILDDLEEIEDGILIKFAVIKALKSIIYNELEAREPRRTIADKFGYRED